MIMADLQVMPENIPIAVPLLIPTFALELSMVELEQFIFPVVFNNLLPLMVVQMKNKTIHIQFLTVETLACLVTSHLLEVYREIMKHDHQTTLSAFGSVSLRLFFSIL
jgi:hypothetical protein